MSLTVIQQHMKRLAHHNPNEAESLSRHLRQIKGLLWNGNPHDGQTVIEDLVMDLDKIETDCASIKALRKSAAEFETYIANNKDMIPNFAERRRYGERVSTGFVECSVNTVIGKGDYPSDFKIYEIWHGKRQQMRWSKQGAQTMGSHKFRFTVSPYYLHVETSRRSATIRITAASLNPDSHSDRRLSANRVEAPKRHKPI